MKRREALAGLTALTFAPAVLVTSAQAVELGERVELPDVTLADKTPWRAAQFAGQPVLVMFWASWCPFCAKVTPMIDKLYRETRNTDLAFLTVSIDEKYQEAFDYMRSRGYAFPFTFEAAKLEAALGTRRALPRTYVVDRDRTLAAREYGEIFEEDVQGFRRFARARG
jgi:thiol-disulfide isomerase/thioredoxin